MSGYGNRVLALLIAALLPVTALATAWVVDVARRERDRLEQMVVANAEKVVSRLDARIEGHISALQALAGSPLVDAGDMDGLRQQLTRAKQHQPLWRNLLLSGPDHRQTLNLMFPDRQVSVPAPDAYAEVFRTGRPGVTPVAVGAVSGYRSLGIMVPVQRDGATLQVLTGVLDTARVAALLRDLLPSDWRGVILDPAGRIVVRTSDGDAAIGEIPSPSALDAVADGREGEIRQSFSQSGEHFVAMYLRSPLTGWTVHVGFPVGALSVLQTSAMQLSVAGAVVSLVLSALLAWLLFRELRANRHQEAALAESQHLEALGRLTGGIAHDFNNLLMIMQSAARGIERRRDDPERVLGYAQTIQTAVQRGAAITRQLLSYARKQRHSPSSFDLAARAEDLRSLLVQSSRGNIKTRLVLPRNLWRIYADANALEVALINLATNARDAMPDGGTLTVSAENVSLRHGDDAETGLRGDYVAISVVDTGSGIEAKHLSRIFQPFFTTKQSGQGTGLGLSQVYGFARQSGGALSVASTVGEGTRFTLYLPRSLDQAARPDPVRPAPAAASGRVLLVEDNTDVARAIERMLGTLGFTSVTASTALAAIERLRADPGFDLVLSDIVLGAGMSGIELEERIRAAHPRLPVVLMTGYSETLADGTARGLHVLSKPFQEDDLLAALRAARTERLELA